MKDPTLLGYPNGKFFSWVDENASAQDNIRYSAWVENINDKVSGAITSEILMYNSKSAKHLTWNRLRVTPMNEHCSLSSAFRLLSQKILRKAKHKRSFSFSLAVFFLQNHSY